MDSPDQWPHAMYLKIMLICFSKEITFDIAAAVGDVIKLSLYRFTVNFLLPGDFSSDWTGILNGNMIRTINKHFII